MNDLFIDIMMNLTSELYQNGEKDINSMLLEQKQNRDSLLQAIASIILFKPVKNEFMELSNKDYFESKKALDKLIKDNFTIEAKSEVKALDKIIEKTAKDKWGINDYVTNLGKDAGVKPIDKKVIDKIKNDKVAGKTAKSRIWNNKDEVYKHTQKRVDEFLKGKISVNDIEKEIKTLYNSNAYNTKRLVNDQIARAQAKANEEWFKENDVEWLLYDATLDGKTCSDCSGLDGKTYERDKARPPIPKHVGCRCCYIGLPDKDWRPDKRLDQITGENIDYKTYKEWYISEGELGEYIQSIISKELSNLKSEFKKECKSLKNDNVKNLLKKEFENVGFRVSNKNKSYYKDDKVYIKDGAPTSTIAHELFHSIDRKHNISNRNMLHEVIQNDYSKLQLQALAKDSTIEEILYNKFPNMFYTNDIGVVKVYEKYRGVSDIINGMTSGKVNLGFYHPSEYWNSNTLQAETWAQYGRMYFQENDELMKVVKELFPQTTNKVNEIIEGLK